MTAQSKGQLIAYLNTEKVKGDSKPTFEGYVKMAGNKEERGFALWLRQRKEDGAMMLTGRVSVPTGTPLEQINSLAGNKVPDLDVNGGKLKLKAGDIVLFHNATKAGSTPGTTEGNRPDFYGWYHSGETGRGLIDLSVWAKTGSNGLAYLTGNLTEGATVKQQAARAAQDQEQVQ